MSPNTILAIDCSGPWVGLALGGPQGPCARFEPMARGQAEHLLDRIARLLADQSMPLEALSALAVGRGPGNFTGLRIALSAARGLALGLGKPCLGISRFEAIAARHGREGVAVIAGPRDQYYVQNLSDQSPPALCSEAALAAIQAPRLPDLAPDDLAPALLDCAERALSQGGALPAPAPLYIKPADAAPAAPGPVLLS